MRGCAPALTVHIKFFHRPGLPRAVVCISKSKIAQAEYKAKARFQALLRRSRFSRRSLREHRQTPFPFVDDAKVQRNSEPHNSSHADSESIRKNHHTIRKELRKNG